MNIFKIRKICVFSINGDGSCPAGSLGLGLKKDADVNNYDISLSHHYVF